LQNAQPFGGKLKDMIRISDKNGSAMYTSLTIHVYRLGGPEVDGAQYLTKTLLWICFSDDTKNNGHPKVPVVPD
jgi:hypothetical protein